MAAGDWIPARETPHPPSQLIAVGGEASFAAPAAANGFFIGANGGPLRITFDGTTASATNGLTVDPGKGAIGLVPVTPTGKVSVYNAAATDTSVEIAWLERLG